MRFTFDERKSIERIFCVQRSYFFCSSNVKRIRGSQLRVNALGIKIKSPFYNLF